MSYILDALRRADAERERGAVPGLHAQAAAPASGLSPAGGAAWRWALGAAVAVGLALLGWLALQRADPAPPLAAAPVQAAPAPLPVPLPAPAPVVLPPPAPVAVLARPAAVARVVPAPVAARASAPAAADKSAAAPLPSAAASPAPAEARVPDLKELPDALRRDLPPLAIGGASYSENPANRMLILNGQVFHEGDRIAPDHVLEQIRLKSAVLRFRGQRYGIAY